MICCCMLLTYILLQSASTDISIIAFKLCKTSCLQQQTQHKFVLNLDKNDMLLYATDLYLNIVGFAIFVQSYINPGSQVHFSST